MNLGQVHLFKRPDLDTATVDSTPPLGSEAAAARRVANLNDRFGHYYVANGDGSGIRLRRADGFTPRTGFGGVGGFQLDTHATSDPRDQSPALVQTERGEIRLYFERASSVYSTSTGDRGATWSAPVSEIPGILPATAKNEVNKSILLTAVQGDNTLLGTIQRLGDRWPNDNHTGATEGTSSYAPFPLKDTTGTTIVTDGTGPALSAPPDGMFVLAIVVNGETDLSHWTNGDFGRTWTRVT